LAFETWAPYCACTATAKTSGTTEPGDPLPYAAPPPGLFVDVRTLES
jgi:hypothetical protein